MSDWERTATANLRRIGVDPESLFAHLARANHVKRPGESWRAKIHALVPGPHAIELLLRPFTPAGKQRPREGEVRALFGAIWAAAEVPSPELLDVVTELVPWCQKRAGTSHQAAAVGMMVLGVWPTSTLGALTRFRDDPTMKSLLATTRASLRKQSEAHPE